MCGIAGIISTSTIEQATIEGMVESLRHRGPDHQNWYLSSSCKIALGHTRLSIIDLRSESNQPFYSSNKRYVIVFNGEIYNFQEIRKELSSRHGVVFKTSSDTEVLIEAYVIWGRDVANKLEGMFAAVIYDQLTNVFFLLRDRIGKKPLFYFLDDKMFAFASEIKSLLKIAYVREKIKIDRKSIGQFLHLGYIPEPNSIYTDIHKFSAGHTGEIGLNLKLQLESFWQVTEQLNATTLIRNASEAKNQLSYLLNEAVKKRMISDVPLGTFLSGGTDSSLVTAIASQYVSSPLKTFNIGFKDDKFNESAYARKVASHLQTNHTEYVLEEKEAVDLLNTYLHHFDEPFADTSAIPTMLVSKLARNDVKVVLTGDGGDELFQGYGAYTWADRLDSIFWKTCRVPLHFAFANSGKNKFQRIAHILDRVTQNNLRSHIFSQEQYLFTQQEIKFKLFKTPNDFTAFEYNERGLPQQLSAAEKQAIFDLQYYLKDDLLVKVDRASMYYGLECRSPLLDHHVIEYALSMDVHLKKRQGKSKWILKELLSDYIPRALVDRPKWGFSIPLEKWLMKELSYLIEDFLNDIIIEDIGLFNKAYIKQLLKDFYAGKDYLYNRLWLIIVMHKWIKENNVGSYG